MDKVFDIQRLNEDIDLPYGIEMVDEKVQFCIPHFDEIKAALEGIAKQSAEQEVTKDNVAKAEKEAASIKKMADGIKKGASKFVEGYTEKLLGKGRGKTKVNGQADDLYDLLMGYYNTLREKTVAIRNLGKEEETKDETVYHKIVVKVPHEMELQFLCYCSSMGLTYEVKE